MTLEQRKRAARVLMARIELDQAIGALTGAPVAEYNAVAGIGNARYYELLEEVFKFISASPVLQRARLAPLREKHRQLGALLENAQQR